MVNAFALLSAALLVTAGNLADRFGRRRVFVAGLLAFAGASAACGLAPSRCCWISPARLREPRPRR